MNLITVRPITKPLNRRLRVMNAILYGDKKEFYEKV